MSRVDRAEQRQAPGSTQRGFSLVELMVALTISLIILAVVAQVFLTSRTTYTLGQGLARTQEAGRFAMEFLAQDLRMAGYTGCASKLAPGTISPSGTCPQGTVCNIAKPPTAANTFNAGGIMAYRYTGSGTALTDWTPNLPSDFFTGVTVKAGTDVILIQRASTISASLTGNTVPNNAQAHIVNTAEIAGEISAGDIIIVSDCKSADVFKATTVSSGGGGKLNIAHSSSSNIQNTFTHSYGNDAEIFKLVSRVYFIRTNTNGEPALYRRSLGTNTIVEEELVEGIEDMRFVFGEDRTTPNPDGQPDIYTTTPVDWANISSVRVVLQARTTSNVGPDVINRSLTIDNLPTLDPPDNDQRQRQFFVSTVQLRN